MKIKRTFKPTSLKTGTTEIIDEEKAREIFRQTWTFVGVNRINYTEQEAMSPMGELRKGSVVSTYFSTFEILPC